MNDLYGNELYKLVNFFLQTFKLLNKQIMGSKIKKLHAKPNTPYQRLMESEHIDKKNKTGFGQYVQKIKHIQITEENRAKDKKDIGNRYIDKLIFSIFEMKVFSERRVTLWGKRIVSYISNTYKLN